MRHFVEVLAKRQETNVAEVARQALREYLDAQEELIGSRSRLGRSVMDQIELVQNRLVRQLNHMSALLLAAIILQQLQLVIQQFLLVKLLIEQQFFKLFQLIQFLVNINPEKLGNAGLLAEVDSLLSEGQVDEALSIAQSDTTYAGKIMAGALSRSYGGTEEIKKGMEEATTTESFRLNAKISYLSLVGNIGPLLGLLGTVTGMISSFQVIESMKAPTPGDLAKGVYESLVNTTMGLFIAIIFLSAYFFMKNRLSEIMLNINSQISEILSHGVFTEPQKAGGR
jgi:biopolymer transport protein ExbB